MSDQNWSPMPGWFRYGKLGFAIFFDTPVYTVARQLFAHADQQTAFLISGLRREFQKTQRVRDLESSLTRRLGALDALIESLPPDDQAEVKRWKTQTSALLSQIRGGGG